MQEQDDQKKAWIKIVAKAWTNDAFRQRFLNDPTATLAEEGFKVPADVSVQVVEQTKDQMVLVLPAKPKLLKLSEEDLQSVSGGKTYPFYYPVPKEWDEMSPREKGEYLAACDAYQKQLYDALMKPPLAGL